MGVQGKVGIILDETEADPAGTHRQRNAGCMMKGIVQSLLVRANRWHSVRSYEALIARKRRKYRHDPDMAMITAIGAASREDFDRQGDCHVDVLRQHGLRDGMAIYDLGCGSGRTASALIRSQWKGSYLGADIVKRLIDYLKSHCPGYHAIVHRDLTIAAPDQSLDIIYHWSVFTHLYPEECYLYMEDSYRALKPGGKLIFSFLEFEDARHQPIFHRRVGDFRERGWSSTLDTLIHRDWIRTWAKNIGFEDLNFTDGFDQSRHAEFWQSLTAMTKPAT